MYVYWNRWTLPHTVRFRILFAFENILHRSSSLFFRLDNDTMDYALSMVRFLRRSPYISFTPKGNG